MVTKQGSTVLGERGTIVDPDWNGMLKLKITTGTHTGQTKSYVASDVEPAPVEPAPPQETADASSTAGVEMGDAPARTATGRIAVHRASSTFVKDDPMSVNGFMPVSSEKGSFDSSRAERLLLPTKAEDIKRFASAHDSEVRRALEKSVRSRWRPDPHGTARESLTPWCPSLRPCAPFAWSCPAGRGEGRVGDRGRNPAHTLIIDATP